MSTPIAIVMIVRNEAPTIAQTLRSAREVLGPGPTIVHDTGSTDNTVDVVCATLNETPDMGNVVAARPFDDFSGARNAVLGHAREALRRDALVMMLSAGCVL